MAIDVEGHINSGESETVELKQSTGEMRRIIEQVPAVVDFIQRHINMVAEIVPTQIERQERWEYRIHATTELPAHSFSSITSNAGGPARCA